MGKEITLQRAITSEPNKLSSRHIAQPHALMEIIQGYIGILICWFELIASLEEITLLKNLQIQKDHMISIEIPRQSDILGIFI